MLTDAACRNASCPDDKPRARYADAGGLYLEVAASGSKRWFVKYRFGGKEKRLALGNYPLVSLKEAREGCDKARKARGEGEDPVQARRVAKVINKAASAQTFEAVAREFFETKKGGWSPKYAARWIERMEKDLFPHIGVMPVGNITAPLLLDVLRRVEKRGAIETAHTLRQTAGQTLRYAVQTGRAERNPALDLQGALKPV